MHPNPSPSEAIYVDAGQPAVLFHDLVDCPRGQVFPLKLPFVVVKAPKERPLAIVGDARKLHVGHHGVRRLQEGLPLPLLALFLHDKVPVGIRSFKVPDFGAG